MFDMTSNAKKACKAALEPGELITGAAAVEPPGMIGRATAASMTRGGEHITAHAAYGVANKQIGALSDQLDSENGIAAGFPAGGVLVVTNRRLLVYTFDARRGKPGDFIHQIPRSQVISSAFKKGKAKDKFQLHFVDGTGRAFETGRMAKLKAVAKALDSVMV